MKNPITGAIRGSSREKATSIPNLGLRALLNKKSFLLEFFVPFLRGLLLSLSVPDFDG